ncbi:MAG: S8 family serine peptidase, partial [Eubacteriales bacterium]
MRFFQKKKENSKKRVLRKWWIPGIVLVMIAVLMVVLFLPARQTETLEAAADEVKSAPVAKTIEADYADLAYQNLLENTPDFDNLTAGEDYTDDEIIILFASDEEKAAVESALTESGAEKLEDISQNMALVKVPEGVSVADYYVALNDTLGEVAAQPNYIYHLLEDETQTNTKKNKSETKKTKEAPDEAPDAFGVTYLTEDMTITATPNDPQTYRQMYLDEIEAFTAWDEVDGFNSGDGVIVAIIDTGIDLDHPDLAANIVDGVCYTGENTTGQDNHGHGTHVAGIVAAVANNGTGVSGVAPGASLMAIKTMASDGYGSTSNIVRGIEYAVANGADIINMSIGALGYDGVLDSAVTYAKNNGVVVVCAAGNEGTDAPAWPS